MRVSPVNVFYHVRTARNEEGSPPPLATRGTGQGDRRPPSCPAVGTQLVNGQAVPLGNTTDPGLRNLAKRHVPDPTGTPKPFTLDDARSLQNYIDNTFADARVKKTLFQPSRAALRAIATFDGKERRRPGSSQRLSRDFP